MFAVIETGGKQYKVSKDSIIKVEKIEGEVGQAIEFNKVLMVKNSDTDSAIGAPFLKNVLVKAEILNQARAPKIIVFKKKRRQNYRRKAGHKQHLTHVKILDLVNV